MYCLRIKNVRFALFVLNYSLIFDRDITGGKYRRLFVQTVGLNHGGEYCIHVVSSGRRFPGLPTDIMYHPCPLRGES